MEEDRTKYEIATLNEFLIETFAKDLRNRCIVGQKRYATLDYKKYKSNQSININMDESIALNYQEKLFIEEL